MWLIFTPFFRQLLLLEALKASSAFIHIHTNGDSVQLKLRAHQVQHTA